ncbi:MAG: DUF1585 domain-containing protein [Deltaproteobacteria bacterium]|nr:DUF1585 domain-containing protein [Deltaproteobacteria bacterium]
MRGRSALALSVVALLAHDSGAGRTLPDYRYFRALSIDLVGRPPTLAELKAFEQPDFDLDRWLDARFADAPYVERVRRVYMDLLRLDLPPSVQFEPPAVMLHWTKIQDPSGKLIDLYFRYGQRRTDPLLDGQACFTEAEIGLKIPSSGPGIGTAKPVSQKLLDERTVVVKPWWLYADYRAATPQERASPEWITRFPGFELLLPLFVEPDGSTPMTGIRVCKEEAQVAEQGRVFATGRIVRKTDPLLPGRLTRLPPDTAFATANVGRAVSCTSNVAFQSSVGCGCGVGLERCVPNWPNGFVMPVLTPLGVTEPFFAAARPAIAWLRTWWGEEASHFIDEIFTNDRDVRELLTSRGTMINGPLAQFYRFLANVTCCGLGTEFGYAQAEPLFDPTMVPPSIVPHEVADWTWVPDRGPQASGLLTMPIFLVKYGTRRQRANAVYSTFLCKEFVAETVKLTPSNEPDLTKRAGCAACHQRLEPLAAYFSRVAESDWTYLPPAQFPVSVERCATADPEKMPGACKAFYDPAFTNAHHATLRGAYASPAHAEAGPVGLADEITAAPEFAPCVVRNVAQSLLGRALTTEDDAWKSEMARTFVDGGYKMRELVRAIVTSPRYRDANDARAVTR